MRLRETCLSTMIALYLLLTANALSYTLFRASLFPTRIIRYFFGMMAPYQGYSTRHLELVAEGETSEGAWERIDLLPYFPGSTGERTFRQFLLSMRVRGDDAARDGYRRMAEEIRSREAENGRIWTAVRLSMETWPVSPDGFETLRVPAFTRRLDPFTLE